MIIDYSRPHPYIFGTNWMHELGFDRAALKSPWVNSVAKLEIYFGKILRVFCDLHECRRVTYTFLGKIVWKLLAKNTKKNLPQSDKYYSESDLISNRKKREMEKRHYAIFRFNGICKQISNRKSNIFQATHYFPLPYAYTFKTLSVKLP